MGTKEEILRIIEKAKRLPVPIRNAADLRAELGFDSLAFIDLLLQIEQKYNITFNLTEMEACLQVDRLIGLVEKKLGEQNHH